MLRKSYPEELFAVSKYLRIIYKMGYNSIKEIQNYTFTGIPWGRMRNHPRIPDVLNSQIYRKPWEGNCRGMAFNPEGRGTPDEADGGDVQDPFRTSAGQGDHGLGFHGWNVA